MIGRPITDLLFCVDSQDPFKYQSRKMISKLRESYQEKPLHAFYREFPEEIYEASEKNAEMYSFLARSVLFDN
jgi:hypothetical protein